MISHVVALSGGKDSTALALRLRELNQTRKYIFFCTPTGNELPELLEHWRVLESLLGTPITYIRNGTLHSLIDTFGALPNWRQRWCTRILKIEPCIAFLRNLEKQDGEKPLLYVGLRADEETREGIYGEEAQSVYPLREWGWGIVQVLRYLRERDVTIPERTDCALCYGQRLREWKRLLVKHEDFYKQGEQYEAQTGYTFRSPRRDTWPASLVELRAAFEKWSVPGEDCDDTGNACRVCTL